ncbi:MAG: hypothetical protein Q4C84_03180 [Bacillota bacterium]|nr:hypothetical protein [Bacillota bacterium]
MKKRVCFITFLLCLSMVGCSANENNKENMSETTDKKISIEESNETGQVDIKGTITEHVTADTKMQIPEKTFATYSTEFKTFDKEKLASLFWPDSSKEEIYVEEYDDKSSAMTFEGETVAVELGTMMYRRNDDIRYLSDIAFYGEEVNLLQEKDLAFMTTGQAVQNVEAFLSELDLGMDFGEKKVFALTKEDMSGIQDRMKADEHFESFYESGKFQERTFNTEDEFYFIKYTFSLNGLPILGAEDPDIQMTGGIERGELAWPMEATVLFSNSGICEINLMGVVDQLEKQSENKEVIQFDGIEKALVKKFGDVILSQEYNLSKIWLEYFPKIKEDSFEEVELIPVWCCEFDINGEEVDYALRFHAFTGEEIS